MELISCRDPWQQTTSNIDGLRPPIIQLQTISGDHHIQVPMDNTCVPCVIFLISFTIVSL